MVSISTCWRTLIPFAVAFAVFLILGVEHIRWLPKPEADGGGCCPCLGIPEGFLPAQAAVVSGGNASNPGAIAEADMCITPDSAGFLPTAEQRKKFRHAQRVFYNRVQKCGSTTSMQVFQSLTRRNGFNYPVENPKIWYMTNRTMQLWVNNEHDMLQMIDMTMNHSLPLLYSSHLYFIDFSRYWATDGPVYTNIIRDPIERQASLYYFFRFAGGHVRPMSEERRHMSYDQCVKLGIPECVQPDTSGFFQLVPYFCGHEPICRYPNTVALTRAKQNVLRHFPVVGLLEHLDDFYIALEFFMPHIFKDAYRTYQVLKTKRNRGMLNKNTHPAISSETRRIMTQKMEIEYNFYEFIKHRFNLMMAYILCKEPNFMKSRYMYRLPPNMLSKLQRSPTFGIYRQVAHREKRT